MTSVTYRGRYLSVAARRRVLEIYRDRRTNWVPVTGGPLPPLAAMQATVNFFGGWLAHTVAYGDATGRKTVEQWTNDYRAAQYYLNRMYRKPKTLQYRATGREVSAA